MEKENLTDDLLAPDESTADYTEPDMTNGTPLLSDKMETVRPGPEKAKTGFCVYTPVIIAAAVLIVTVLIFSGWKLFFEKNIKGIWTLDLSSGDDECSVSLELADDGVCYFHEGAIIYKGSYKFSQAADGQELLKTEFTKYGQPAISASFYYAVEGSNVTGKSLVLTDLTGLIFNPYNVSENTGNDPETLGYDYIEKDGIRYFRLSIRSDNGYQTRCDKPENAKTDEKLTGIWLNKNDDTRYDNTYAFYDDNTLQITYRDIIYKGSYSASDGKCSFTFVSYTGKKQENEFDYKFEGDKLTITIQDVPAVYTRTDSVTAFDNGIK